MPVGGNALAAAITKDVFEVRGVGPDQLPKAAVDLLPLDEKAEADRAARVEQGTGPASPGLARDTTDVLFRDLWLRPDLAPRDRSLVTVSALISAGQIEQIRWRENRAAVRAGAIGRIDPHGVREKQHDGVHWRRARWPRVLVGLSGSRR